MARIPHVSRFIGDEDEMPLWWERNGDLIDFSIIGWTFSATCSTITVPETVLFTKTTGFTGDSGTGNPQSGTPNLNVQFSTVGELNLITEAGRYRFVIVATDASDAETTMEVLLDMRER